MQTPKIVSDYLDAAVPKGLTESRRKLLTEELESHIYDKAEHYMEIGYPEEESFEKAIEAMGKAEDVSEQLENVYQESRVKAALTFVGITAANLLSLCLGFGYSLLYIAAGAGLGCEYYFESHILSSLAIYCIFLAILSAYQDGNRLKLKAIGYANLLMLLTPFLFNNLYQPFFLALLYVFGWMVQADVTDPSDATFLIPLFFGELLSVFFCVLSFALSTKKRKTELTAEKSNRCNRFKKIIATVLPPIFALSLFTFITVSIKNDAGYCFAVSDAMYLSDLEKQQISADELYASLNDFITFTQADRKLKKAGYLASNGIEKIVTDPDEIENALIYLKEHYSFDPQKEVAYFPYAKSNYLSLENSIILKNTGSAPLTEKRYLDIANGNASDSYFFTIFNRMTVSNCRKAFERLSVGQEKTEAIRHIQRSCGLRPKWIETSFREGYVIETVHFDGIISKSLSEDYSTVDIKIIFFNGAIFKGSFTLSEYIRDYDADVFAESSEDWFQENRTVITLPRQEQSEADKTG